MSHLIESGCTGVVTGDNAELMHGLAEGAQVILVGVDPNYSGERVWVVEAGDGERYDVAERDMVIGPKPEPSWFGGNQVTVSPGAAIIRGQVFRETSSTGASKDSKLARYDQIPAYPLRMLAERFGAGSQKYPPVNGLDNWRNGYAWSLSYAAMQRHLWAFWGGEDIDPDTGQPHLAAVAWHAFALMEWGRHPGLVEKFDDRQDPKEIGQ